MDLDDLKVYRRAMLLADEIWGIMSSSDEFARHTVGRQWVRAADPIAANISEGFGRFSYKENRRFCYYARGSLHETRTWLRKAADRRLIDANTYERLHDQLGVTARMLNRYIQSIGACANDED